MCRSDPQMLVATIFRMTPCGALLPFGISSFGKSRDSTRMSLTFWNTTARLLLAMTISSSCGWPGRGSATVIWMPVARDLGSLRA